MIHDSKFYDCNGVTAAQLLAMLERYKNDGGDMDAKLSYAESVIVRTVTMNEEGVDFS